MIMAIEKKIGRPTKRVASRTVAATSRRLRGSTTADLDEAEGILGHHDGRIHQHANGDGDPSQGHQWR